jgi:CubicO group peptidase (beta-lactamase class C family)
VFDLVAPETAGMSSERLRRVGGWMRDHVEKERLAGISVLVQRRGRNVYFDSAGYLAQGEQRRISPDSIFRIYSMTKPITSVAAMMLYEEGRFQLDDPVAKFLPEFTEMQVLVGGDADRPQLEPAHSLITLRQLLTHTSGLTYDFMMSSPVDALYRREKITFATGDSSLAEVVERLARLPLLCQPGARWNYGVSTDVLGRVVEVVSGQSLERFFAERILGPLGMNDTGFHVAADKLPRFACMYASSCDLPPPRIGPEPTRVQPESPGGLKLMDPAVDGRFSRPPKVLSGGGGLTSTTADYLRFCQMLRNKGELDGVRLLGRKTAEFMTMNHLPGSMADLGQPRFNNAHMGAGLGFGLGFAVVLDPARAQAMGSPGEYYWTGVANTQFWIDPVEDLIVIQMAQLMPSTQVPLRRELRSLVYPALVD